MKWAFLSPDVSVFAVIMTGKSQRRPRNKAQPRIERRFRATFENSAIAMMMADFTGRILAANEAFRKMLGYTESELSRLTFLDITHEEDRAANLRLVKDLQDRKRQHFQIEKRYRRKDGTPIWVRTNVARVPGLRDMSPFWFKVVEDITPRKRVEEELRLQIARLRETEARLQTFFEHSPNLIFLKDRQGRYLYVNKEHKKALRISDEQVKGKRDDEIFQAEQAAAFQANDRRVLEEGVPMEFEETALQEDGQHTSIVHKFPLFDAAGEIYAIGGIVTDITERKRAESARRLSDEKYRVLVETASDAIVSIDGSGSILFANPATTRIFGYESVEMIGKPVTMLMPEFMRKMHESESGRLSESGERDRSWRGIEVIALNKNGREFPVEISLGELNRSGQRMFTGFIRDISERKQAEEMRGIAVDFLTKPFRDEDVLDAVRIALERGRDRRELGQGVSKIRQRFESLTPREQEVISMVVSGMINKQIADRLGTSENTVKVQRSRAIEKMHAKSLPDLVRMMELLKDLSKEPG